MLPCHSMPPYPRYLQSSRRIFLAQTLSLAATAGMAVASSGCISLVGVQSAEFDMTVQQPPGGTVDFFWWNELDIHYDTSSVNNATLYAATVDVQGPEGTPDMSFLQSVVGTAVVGEQRTEVIRSDKFPPGEQAVIMKVQYHDDLRPLFRDGHIIRVEWTGKLNPAFTQWPPEGFALRARLKINIE
jgi:hypothetical protein